MPAFLRTAMIKENRHIAEQTLNAIAEAMAKDQGSSFRYYSGQLIPGLKDAYDSDNTPFRSHLGASMIGGKCDRALWYGFRWHTVPNHDGRLLRLFNRGHLEEGRFIAALMTIGVQIYQYDDKGTQFRISDIYGHFGGSTDGVAIGLPECPSHYVLTEFKTHGEKSFIKLQKEGVRESKFEHYVQMQIYMYKKGLQLALYMAVNKNTDEIYGEFITLNEPVAKIYIERAHSIIFAKTPPKKLSESPGWYECKFCDHFKLCHTDGHPSVNCRTCKFSEPVDEGLWQCNKYQIFPTKEQQLQGCQSWEPI